jgi:hypothetical protein
VFGTVVRHKISNTRKALSELSEHCRKRVLSMCFKVMYGARDSIQISPDPSEPGKPPHSRDGTLPKSIFFDISMVGGDPSGVVGPIAFNDGAGSDGDITHALEYGGETQQQDGRKTEMAERPFMQPALKAMQRQIAEIWRRETM